MGPTVDGCYSIQTYIYRQGIITKGGNRVSRAGYEKKSLDEISDLSVPEIEKVIEMLKNRYRKEIEELENAILNSNLRKQMKPLFYDYFQSSVTTKEGIKNYFMQNAAIFELLNAKEKDILEVGCGFGLRLICMALMGARKIAGIDISEEMIESFQKLIKRFPQLDLKAKRGDFLLIDYPPSSFDVVLLVEAISHIRDTQLLLDKIRDVLCPSGILYIHDGNNDLFLPSRIRSRRDWRKAERGPIDESMARHGREVDKFCFFEARMKIIQGN
jgi:2-polyprenyl-3-methyl-5-hydroxy-6-metoxy-1,4-benzoquinol methylase